MHNIKPNFDKLFGVLKRYYCKAINEKTTIKKRGSGPGKDATTVLAFLQKRIINEHIGVFKKARLIAQQLLSLAG